LGFCTVHQNVNILTLKFLTLKSECISLERQTFQSTSKPF
jgi:hypothetical protein